MADITMCANEDCPKRETCYRATAERKEYWQAWSKFGPDESGECPWYWKDEPCLKHSSSRV